MTTLDRAGSQPAANTNPPGALSRPGTPLKPVAGDEVRPPHQAFSLCLTGDGWTLDKPAAPAIVGTQSAQFIALNVRPSGLLRQALTDASALKAGAFFVYPPETDTMTTPQTKAAKVPKVPKDIMLGLRMNSALRDNFNAAVAANGLDAPDVLRSFMRCYVANPKRFCIGMFEDRSASLESTT